MSKERRMKSPSVGWARTGAQENARYRDTVLMTKLTRSATAARTFAARVAPEGGSYDKTFIDLLDNVRNQISEDLQQYENGVGRHHAAYLRPTMQTRLEVGRDLEQRIRELVEQLRSPAADVLTVTRLRREIMELTAGFAGQKPATK